MVRAVFIGDDFTGASDTLATYASAGWRTRLFLRPPQPSECEGFDAIGIATALRALTPEAAQTVIEEIWPAIAALDPETLHFKICSTFDSSPQIGSIGAVTNALALRFAPEHLAVIGGQPNLGRYCVFGTLFAKASDGNVYRIDRHPVMAQHPVTPMSEADLRLLLSEQGLEDLTLVRGDRPAELPLRALFDVYDNGDISRISETFAGLRGHRLLVGASSVAQILTHGPTGSANTLPPGAPPNSRVLVVAGSRSSVTSAQVAKAEGFTKIRILPEDMENAPQIAEKAAELLKANVPTLVHIDPQLDYGMSPDALALALAKLTARIIALAPVGWLGIAGGDTSSRICDLLDFSAIDYLSDFQPGIGLNCAQHSSPEINAIRLILKGGQMGTPNLFSQFLGTAQA
ncbi:MAG: four-carbon acid sugar kinase family protein [Heliomarina sp.]|uniref:four-carbon acid sugar kinase family protein n=1 Tax=Heliomarina sp. TaxID=2917556 RepID=UPI004058D9F1